MIPPTSGDGYSDRLERLNEIAEHVTGHRIPLKLKRGHSLMALAFTNEGQVKPISGLMQVSLAYTDALQLASRVIQAGVV